MTYLVGDGRSCSATSTTSLPESLQKQAIAQLDQIKAG
jgi:hypothetical protein